MQHNTYKPRKIKFLFGITFLIYSLVLLISVWISHNNGSNMTGVIETIKWSPMFLIWAFVLIFIISTQRLILTDKTITYKVLGLTRTRATFDDISEIKKETMSGSPVYVLKINKKPKRKPIPLLPFEEAWEVLLPHLESNHPSIKIDTVEPRYRNTYRKYEYVKKD